jgi:hypothetical protein
VFFSKCVFVGATSRDERSEARAWDRFQMEIVLVVHVAHSDDEFDADAHCQIRFRFLTVEELFPVTKTHLVLQSI